MKRVLAMCLAAMMIFSMLPLSAFAVAAVPVHEHTEDCKCPGQGAEHKLDNCSSVEYEVVPSKCGELGYTIYQCTECQDFFAANFNVVEGVHNYQKVSDRVDATCTAVGANEKWVCADCGQVDPTRNGSVVNALGHAWEVVSVTGDCLVGGVKTEQCKVCEKVQTTPIDGTGNGHAWGAYPTEITEPTCEGDGKAVFTCAVCGDTKDVVIKAVGHKPVDDKAVAPGCETTGLTAGSHCETCQKVLVAQEVVDATGHDWVNSNIVGATCTEKGSYTKTCSVCEKSEKVENEALGHSFAKENDGWVIIDMPDCTKTGEAKRECLECDYVEHKDVDALPHTYDYENPEIVPAGCNSWGLYVYYCTKCGDLKPQNPDEDKIAPLGHTTYDDATSTNKVEVAERCDANGSRTWNCGRCGAAQTAVVDEYDGHDVLTMVVAPTCNKLGYTYTICNRPYACNLEPSMTYTFEGKEYAVGQTIVAGSATVLLPVRVISFVLGTKYDADEHELKEELIQEPTCTEPGSKKVYCPNCSYLEPIVVIPELGHDYDVTKAENVTVKTPADCLNAEQLIVKCSRCDTTTGMEGAAALGHTEVKVPAKTPTCTEAGYEEYVKCDVCGWNSGINTLDKVPHNYQATVYDVTCEQDGYTHYECACGEKYNEVGTKYEYDAEKEFASFADAQKLHPQLDATTRKFVRAGDCTITALDEYTCAHCGKTVLVIADESTGKHAWGAEPSTDKVEPACGVAGAEAIYTCTRCGETKGGEAIDALVHDMSDATCTDAAKCKRPGCNYVGTNALTHDWAAWTALNDADRATYNACHTRVCARCNAVEYEAYVDADYDISNPDVFATCTQPGAYKCDTCGNVYQTIQPMGHHYMVAYNWTANCTEAGFNFNVCVGCNDEYMDMYVSPLGHKYDAVAEKLPTCKEDGHTAGTQCACGLYDVKPETVPALDYHKNGKGETLKNECTNVVEGDRVCVWCEATIGQAHTSIFEVEVAPDCNSEGYTLSICAACNVQSVGNYVPMRAEHDWSDWKVEVEPTYTNKGVKTRYCRCCVAEGLDVYEHEDIPSLNGFAFEMDVDNANAAGAGFTDSSLVALTINMNSVDAKAWGVMFRVNYTDNLTFVKAEFSDNNQFAANQMAVNNDGYVSISAFAPNNEQKQMQDITVSEKMAFVTLYFRVTNGEIADVATTAAFAMSNVSIVNVNGDDMSAATDSAIIDIVKLMDVNADGDVTIHDILMAEKMLAGVLDAEYDVALDVDKDGEVTAYDVYTILQYMNGALTYEEVVAAE